MKRRIRIQAFSLGPPDSSICQLRIVGPFSYLPKNEFEFVYAPTFEAILKLPYIPDAVIFHRNFYRFKEMSKIIKFAHAHRIITIMDIDDLITHVPPYHSSYSYYQKIRPAMVQLLKTVDIVTVTNNRLKEYYNTYNSHVYVLPNLSDERIWNDKNRKERTDRDKVVIGYAGSATHAYDFEIVIPAIKHILLNYGDKVCFKFIGYFPDELQTMFGIYHISAGIASYQQYANILMNSNFDFAIAPLNDNAFNQCKSNIKFLEYSICGYAGIYSAVGPYIDSIKHNETGLLIKNTTDAWISAMELLINNPELRNNLGRNAYRCVKADYSLKERSKEWYQLYSQIIPFQRKGNVFSLSPLISYGSYILYVQLRKVYRWILSGFQRMFLSR